MGNEDPECAMPNVSAMRSALEFTFVSISTLKGDVFSKVYVNSCPDSDKVCMAQCLKMTEMVSFGTASEASYDYILIGQKIIKNVKNGQLVRVF